MNESESIECKNAKARLVTRTVGAGLVLLVWGAVACSGRVETGVTRSRESFIGGRVLEDEESLNSAAVLVYRNGICSGTLVDARVVLTAGHCLTGPNAERHPDKRIEVEHGNEGLGGMAKSVGVAFYHPTFHATLQEVLWSSGEPKLDPSGRRQFKEKIDGLDLAVVYLDGPLGNETEYPDLDCDPELPSKLRIVSAFNHTVTDPRTFVMNEDTFTVDPDMTASSDPWEILVRFPGARGARSDSGDSGSGAYDTAVLNPARQLVSAVHVSRSSGWGTSVDLSYTSKDVDTCRWVHSLVDRRNEMEVYRGDFDLEDEVPDVFTLNPVAGDQYTLVADVSAVGSQSFEVELAGLLTIQSVTLGNYSNDGFSLAVTDGTTLVTGSFNGGPAPSVTGEVESEYIRLDSAYLNADPFEDIVALRLDGQTDVYLGSADGIVLAPEIRLIGMRLDADELPDYVWLSGGAGIHLTSSARRREFLPDRGHSFIELVPASLDLTDLQTGVFRRQSGARVGQQDLVTVGDGVLVWCRSNGFGSVSCENGVLESGSTRHATHFSLEDLNGDGLDDIRAFYSDSSPRVFVAQNDGFAQSFGFRVRDAVGVDLDGDSDPDTVTIDSSNGNVALRVRLFPQGSGDFGPFVTDIPFVEPVTTISANFNGDEADPNALAITDGIGDLAILSGGRVFALISNGDGTLATSELQGEGDFVAIEVLDANGDGIGDLEALREDGSASVFLGSDAGGLDPVGENFTGLPTPDSNDGKMLLLSGLGVDTVGATEGRFRIVVGTDNAAALDHLAVQVFDGDNGGLHQFEEATNLLKTCYRLSADPCGDGNSGSCAGGPIEPVEIVTGSSDSFGDDVWDTLYDGPHSPDASIAGDGQAPYGYELRVYLSEDCEDLPEPGVTLAVPTADAFKLRSNGMLSMPAGEFSLVGSDRDDAFGIVRFLRDTDFDGKFDLPIAVGSSATEIQLKEADADDLDDATEGVSLGANAEIQYRLVDPNGAAAALVGAENTAPALAATNLSGNNDGVGDLDVETRIHTLSAPLPGTWTWQWENVRAANAFHVFTPFGSPTTHEVLGARRRRPQLSSAQQPYFWQEQRGSLEAALPVVLGRASDGTLEGTSVEVTSAAHALDLLENAGGTSSGELLRQLLVAKLNAKRGLAEAGEDLTGALVYGTTRTVRHLFRDADASVAGLDLFPSDAKIHRLVTLLSAVNLGEVTYQQPGVPFPEQPMADSDADGIIDVKDNCPSVANVGQEDEDDNRIGDACNVVPVLDCVLHRSPDTLAAFFSYENPLSLRTIALGSRNEVLNGSEAWDFEQPSEFGAGRQAAFSAEFGAPESVSWALEGDVVIADRESPACSGKEQARVEFAAQAALFGAESVKLGDHVTVKARADFASIVSGGKVEIGADSAVGHVFAKGEAVLGSQAAVRGALVSGETVRKLGAASVLGSVRERAVLPGHSIAWWVDFAGSAGDVELGVNESRRLEPGSYGHVVVPAGATLRLGTGRYRFASLAVARTGALAIEASAVTLHVAEALVHQGVTRVADSAAAFVLGYFGTAPAAIDASFTGTVVAPNAELVLGAVRNASYRGAFFARVLEVRPTSSVEYADQ